MTEIVAGLQGDGLAVAVDGVPVDMIVQILSRFDDVGNAELGAGVSMYAVGKLPFERP